MAEENDSILHRIPFSGKFSDIANWLNENFHLIELAIKQNTGKSAYEVWRDYTDGQGNQPNIDKTEEEFLASLKESGYKMQAVTARPSTIAGIEADKIYLYPDGTGQFSTAIYTGDLNSTYDSTKWVVLATNPGDLSGAFSDISGLRTDVNNLSALVGYFTCDTAAATAAKTVNATGYVLTNGGNIRIKMTNANTAASGVTLQIGNATAKELYYNDSPVDSENSWKDNETIIVYYDGEKYLATNSLGGGGNSALVEELDKQLNGSTESIELNVQDQSYVSDRWTDDGTRWLNTNTLIPTIVIPIEPNSSITIVGNTTHNITYAIFKTFDTSVSPSGQMLTALLTLSANETVTVDATEDGHYLYIRMAYSSGIKYPQSVTQNIYIKGLVDEINDLGNLGKFATGENVNDIDIDDTPKENSNGLVKSGGIFPHLYAQVEEEHVTPSLTGTIGDSYKNYYFSAGKTVYDHDVRVTKLIFNENIRDYGSDTTFNFYIADPYSVKSEFGSAIEGTILAGTNYADVNVIVPAGQIIYVKNKSVSGSSALFKPDCLIASTANSEESYYCDYIGTGKGTMLAGFSYVYSVAVGIKEYVDLKNEEILEKIEEGITDKDKVTWKDANLTVVFGSSLTDQRFAPAGHIWLEEINNLVDTNISNHALSGSQFRKNITDCIALAVKPDWILWNNQANGSLENPEAVPFGMNGFIQLTNAKEVTESRGAAMLLGGENGTANGNILLKNVDRLFDVFANDNNVPRSELRRELTGNIVNSTYPRFNSGVHLGWRTQAPFITKHLELLGSLPIEKSVKIFKLRPNSLNVIISDLAYDTPLQRMKNFYAASTGVAINGSQITSNFQKCDNIKQNKEDNPEPYYPTPLSERDTIGERETEKLINGEDITIPKGKAVVEFVVDRENINECTFTFICSEEQPQVYISISHNSNTTPYTDSPRSSWQEISEMSTSEGYPGYKITLNIAQEYISLYDNVKFLVVASGEFTIRKPELEYKGGRKKKTPVLTYKPRRYGTEVNDNLHIDSNDWTLTGSSAINQVPSSIGLYAANTYHIELSSQGDAASKTVTIPAGTKKVAIRVMAQRFVKIMTKLFAGTSDANSPYVSETQVINNYDCDLGIMDIIINDAAVSRHVLCPGFAWNYVEFAPDLTDTSLKIEVRKPDGDTAPTMIYALSVQVIE